MKKLAILLALILLLSACGMPLPTATPGNTTLLGNPVTTAPTQPSTAPSSNPTTVPAPQPLSFLLYMPDETLEGFVTEEMTLEVLDPERIVAALIEKGVLAADVAVISLSVNGSELALDMNEAFLMQVYTMGTTGERMLFGCLVNTFLSAYDCECVMLTVDGEIIDSGHVVYEEPLYPFQ